MARKKGYKGQACHEALRASISPGEIASFTQLYNRVREKGAWRDDAIWQHLMLCVVNLPPARRRWKYRKPFLFLRPDGQYELYDPSKHPIVIE